VTAARPGTSTACRPSAAAGRGPAPDVATCLKCDAWQVRIERHGADQLALIRIYAGCASLTSKNSGGPPSAKEYVVARFASFCMVTDALGGTSSSTAASDNAGQAAAASERSFLTSLPAGDPDTDFAFMLCRWSHPQP